MPHPTRTDIALGLLIFSTAAAGCSEDVLTDVSTVTDEFLQNSAAEIDVLWVVDNSESMAEEQEGLGLSFQGFIDNLLESEVHYRIGVISTDTTDRGVLHAGASGIAVIEPDTEDATGVFLENVNVGTSGSRIERAFESTALALGKGLSWRPGDPATPPNPDFLREGAALFIIMVSDEDDKSFGPVGYYGRLFDSYKGPGNEARISISAVVGPPAGGGVGGAGGGTGGAGGNDDEGGCVDPDRGAAAPGDRYVDLAGAAGGIYTSICADFVESLRNLSLTAAGLNSIFELSKVANVEGLVRGCGDLPMGPFCVRVDGTPVPEDPADGWTYIPESNSILFGVNAVPTPQAAITVEYRR